MKCLILTAICLILSDLISPNYKNIVESKVSGTSNKDGTKNTDKPESKKKKCCPYNFNSTMCRTIGDRIQCGYENNQGSDQNSKDRVVRLNEGCVLRNGRIECFYHPLEGYGYGAYGPQDVNPSGTSQGESKPQKDAKKPCWNG
ncbi:hypothetical protein JYU34_014484 [Plutella xylostella]|uniref:Uncharacterized protein n=1 Tax=Plutella xylostella TaxID=51655 RepID=A0ABQ7Q8E3_PLUXY|nr:hypothetical protein JYU34_014484 [Plutella xylostella]